LKSRNGAVLASPTIVVVAGAVFVVVVVVALNAVVVVVVVVVKVWESLLLLLLLPSMLLLSSRCWFRGCHRQVVFVFAQQFSWLSSSLSKSFLWDSFLLVSSMILCLRRCRFFVVVVVVVKVIFDFVIA
jgi:hypothetical protein